MNRASETFGMPLNIPNKQTNIMRESTRRVRERAERIFEKNG